MFSVYGLDGSWVANYPTIDDLKAELSSYTEEGSSVFIIKFNADIVGSITTIDDHDQFLITLLLSAPK